MRAAGPASFDTVHETIRSNHYEANVPEADDERLPIVADDDHPVPAEFDADRLVRDATGVARGEISDRTFARKYGDGDSKDGDTSPDSPE
ncbi:hypothetical protein JCM17823_29620 [Halorubrum gandharaense]